MKSLTIALGDHTFSIKELTIGQMEQIHDVLQIAREGGHARAQTNREVIAAALAVDYPEVTAEAIKGFRVARIQDVSAAADSILEFSGWILPKEGAAPAPDGEGKQPGEATAA